MRERAPPGGSPPPQAEGLAARLTLMAVFTVGLFGALALRRQGLRLEGSIGLAEARASWAMAGLAVGGALGLGVTARLADTVERPLFALGLATVFAAAGESFWSFATSYLGSPEDAFDRALATGFGFAGPAANLAAVLTFAVAALTRTEPDRAGRAERASASLAAGAAVGLVLLGGALGALATNGAAVVAAQRVTLLVGLVLVVRGWRAPKVPALPAAPPVEPRTRRLALALAALTGASFAALSLGWLRLADLVMGPAPTVRAMVLAPLALGTAAGLGWASARSEPPALFAFARRQLGLVGFGAVLLLLLPRFPWLMLSLGRMVRHTPPAWLPWQLVRLVVGAGTAGPLAFLCAASLGSASRLLSGPASRTRALAQAAGSAALGAALLALAAALVPWLARGAPAVCVTAVLIAAFAAMSALTVRVEVPWSKLQRQLVLAAAGLVALASCAWLATDLQLGAADVAVAGRAAEWPLPVGGLNRYRKTIADRATVVFRKDDPDATSIVEEQGGRRTLRVNGRVEATARESVELERLAAHLGALLGEAPRSALVLGPRSGAVVPALLAYPLERLTIVAASRSELEAAQAFAKEHAAAFADPRVHVAVDGPTAAVRRAAGRVDVIVASATPGAASELFTEEFMAAARACLGPGGRLVVRLDVGDWPEAVVRRAVHTARSAFDWGTTWGSDEEAFLVLSERALPLEPAVLAPRLAEPRVARSLAELGVSSPLTLLGHQLQSDAAQKAFAADARVNTRDDDLIAFGADVGAFAPADWKFPDDRHALPPGADLAIAQATAQEPLPALEARELAGSLGRVNGLRDPLVRAAAEVWLEREPASEPASVAVARSALAQGNPTAAKVVLEPLILGGARTPELVTAWLETERALLRREGGPWSPDLKADAALELGKVVLAKTPRDAELAEAVQKLEEVR